MADETNPGDEPLAENPKYDQDFFLALAAKGKDAWNAWRHDPANKGVCVTFAGIDFSEAPRDEIDFSGFEFGDGADFSRCRWRGGWTPPFLLGRAAFFGAAFGDSARFDDAVFGAWATFADATFGEDALFVGATFGRSAIFSGVAFGDGARFDRTHFKSSVVEFTGMSKKEWTVHLEAKAHSADMEMGAIMSLKKRHEDSWARCGSAPDRFLTISFADARFDGYADFSSRTFEKIAYFTNARFYRPPVFDAMAKDARIDFTGAYVGFVRPGSPHWTFEIPILVRLRALRKIADDTKHHDLERDLYIEERKAERGVYLVQRFKDWVRDPKKKWALFAHILWIIITGAYWALADYGRSFLRPFAWLIASGFFFYWCYSEVLAPLMPQAGTPAEAKYEHAMGMLALGNAVPFVGPLTIDSEVKKFLFCPSGDGSCLPPIPPEGFQFLVIAQNLASITCVFFIGLALRNYFKIK